VVEDRPIITAKHCLPIPVFHFWPKVTNLQCYLSAIAELLVNHICPTPNSQPVHATMIRLGEYHRYCSVNFHSPCYVLYCTRYSPTAQCQLFNKL